MMIYLFHELYAAIIHLLAAGELGYFAQPHRIRDKRFSSGNVGGGGRMSQLFQLDCFSSKSFLIFLTVKATPPIEILYIAYYLY